jgi:hypothetical protein
MAIGENGCEFDGKRAFAGRLSTQINFSKGKSTVDLGQASVDLRLGFGRLLSGEY